jgi:ATP phosphoribosyltransferase regulatory subunit HisZ
MNLTGILEAHDDLVVDLGHVQIVAALLEVINGGRTIKLALTSATLLLQRRPCWPPW